MSELVLIVKGKAQPGQREQVQRLFEQHLAPRALENEAQELVVWSADEHDADTFYLFELYRDRAVMEANGRTPWFGDYFAAVGPLLAGQPEMVLATPKWRKPTSD